MALALYDLISNINKQIKNICCKIEQGGGGGGSSTNIYNSDGTLTGDRNLIGNNKSLAFLNLNSYITTTNTFFSIAKSVFPNVSAVSTSSIGTQITLDAFNQLNSSLNTTFFVNQSLIKTIYGSNDIGLKLDFANNQYLLGNKTQLLISENTLGNTSTLSIYVNNIDSNGMLFNFSDVNNAIFDYAYIGDVTYMQNGTMLFISDTNSIINTKYQNTDQGLKLDFANTLYQFGQINGGNQTYINIDDQFPTIRTYIGNINNGISFEGTSTYKFGQITGGNTKTFAIDDAAGFGFQFSGTGITQATTGSASGQYLKVKVGGNDYVIELKNPS